MREQFLIYSHDLTEAREQICTMCPQFTKIFGHDLIKRGSDLVQRVQSLLKQGNKFLIRDQNIYILVHLLVTCTYHLFISS